MVPKYLIEIHGHGAKSIADNQIEISSGSLARNNVSTTFASILQSKLLKSEELKGYLSIGDFNKVYFRGTKSATIIDERWTSLHIELPPSLKLNPNDSTLPLSGMDLTKCLIETINEVCI